MKSNRKGIALLWVVLTSALILVAILGISMRVVPQKKVENSREYTQRALAVAESGMAEITYNLRTDTASPTVAADGSPTTVNIKVLLQSGKTYDSGVVQYNSGTDTTRVYDSTYQVLIKPATPATSGYTFYSLGTVVTAAEDPLARQSISVQYSRNFPIGDYALYSERELDLQNGTIVGSAYGSLVSIKNGTVNGTVYYTDPMSSMPSGASSTHVTQVSFPTIDMAKYKDLYNDFVTGSGSYSGSDTTGDYPTTTGDIHTFLAQYFSPSVAASETNFQNFWTAIQAATETTVPSPPAGSPAGYLRRYLAKGKLVFYVEPTKFSGNLYKTAPFLEGTIIVKGDVDISGGVVIGDPARPSNTAILAEDGAVTVGAGGATINGFLYIAGASKHGNDPLLSCQTTGGLTCNGSIVALGTISANSNGLKVTWEANNVYHDALQSTVPPLNAVPSSWRQISYDAFETVATQP